MNKQDLDRYRSQGASALVDAYEKLVGERDALAAHVELIDKTLAQHGKTIELSDSYQFQIDDDILDKVLAQSPQTSLAERDAEVAISAALTACRNVADARFDESDFMDFATQYANQLREQSK